MEKLSQHQQQAHSPRRSTSSSAECHLEVSYSGSPCTAKAARIRLRQALADWGLPFTISYEDLMSAVGEAVSNAWRHGCSCGSGTIKLTATYNPDDRHITVEISDPGPGFDTSKPFRTEYIGGRYICASGRFIMSKSVDNVSYERRGQWWVCRLEKTL